MITRFYTIVLLGLLLVGCNRPESNVDWTSVVRIRPFVVQNESQETPWTNDRISRNIHNANLYWKSTGIQFKMLDPQVVVDEGLYDSDGLFDFGKVVLRSRRLALDQEAYPVFFVNKITWGGELVAGVSTTADAPFGFQYGTIIAGNRRSNNSSILAHELAHAWNLRHTWSDKHKDTPSKNKDDCNPDIRCNVMSYCFPSFDCEPLWSVEQIAEIRKWALSSSRIYLMTMVPDDIMVVKTLSYELSDKFEPIVD